ncbi:ketopantoate reductase family protein [Streptomyces bohaiensis]|uniref:NAD(P)-binding domain-containing protein n=1 Tax=Streptomyces bohaiensis TaxID=1431344 RepID=A0ABX1CJL3_9ACTN|nr:2-dehydropantoate 2-reductase N-terminal domain-containing protein [Streptomyces bohaiensis]NJQ17622.1 NAD(P)-binding domain-containing protein [Streptomyces bohaiensis]
MRYIIIGAGAVGGAIGGRLFQGGHEVVLVARGDHLAALREEGLHLAVPDDALTLPVPAVADPREVTLRPDDVLVLSVKVQDAVAALDAWAPRPVEGGGTAGELLPLVCAQNGVAGERMALRRFRHVYGMCVWLPAQFLRPGHVVAHCAPLTGMLHIGRYPTGTDDTARRIAADLESSHFAAPVPADVMRWKYGKLLSNLANALDAVGGTVLRGDARAAELLRRARAEAVAVLDAAGIEPVTAEEQQHVRGDRMQVRPVAGAEPGGGSSWQSLSRGTGSIEADYLNGEIVLLGREYGIETPVNEVLQRMANVFAHEHRRPGSLTPAELAVLGALAGEAD